MSLDYPRPHHEECGCPDCDSALCDRCGVTHWDHRDLCETCEREGWVRCETCRGERPCDLCDEGWVKRDAMPAWAMDEKGVQ